MTGLARKKITAREFSKKKWRKTGVPQLDQKVPKMEGAAEGNGN